MAKACKNENPMLNFDWTRLMKHRKKVGLFSVSWLAYDIEYFQRFYVHTFYPKEVLCRIAREKCETLERTQTHTRA